MLRLPYRLLPQRALSRPTTTAACLMRAKSTTTTSLSSPAVSDGTPAAADGPTSREIIAEKSKLLEGKYAAALKRKMEACVPSLSARTNGSRRADCAPPPLSPASAPVISEGLQSIEELKAKKLAAEESTLAAARERRAMSASTASAAGAAGSSLKGTYVPPVPKASSSSPIAVRLPTRIYRNSVRGY